MRAAMANPGGVSGFQSVPIPEIHWVDGIVEDTRNCRLGVFPFVVHQEAGTPHQLFSLVSFFHESMSEHNGEEDKPGTISEPS